MASLAADLPFDLGGDDPLNTVRDNFPRPVVNAGGADYGRDVAALDDLPDPEVLVSGDLNVAYAIARHWLQASDGLVEIGDETPYDSFDLRDYLGKRIVPGELRALEALAARCARQDPRVDTIAVTLSFLNGALSLTGRGVGSAGPFSLVLTVDGVTVQILQGA